ncbi:MAG: LysR family transcriptional regulator [Phycisphaerales bacterium]|nr:LysR family transcriptional regulator [Phycisphaerales bacterium]
MDIRQLRSFIAVAEAGTISRAAERCGITQPSLSQQIMKLEENLGVTLLDRLGRGVALTEAGHALLPRARQVVAQIAEIESALRADLDEGRGRLAVGAIPTMAPYLIPPLVAALRAESPDCEIFVREDLTQHLVEAIADNQVDIAIMSTPVEHDQIELEIVGREPLLVVAPTEHPLCAAGEIALADLQAQPAVTLHEMHCLGRQISDFCAANRLARNVVCRMTQIDTLLEFVRLGLGLSLVPAMVAAHDSHPGRTYLPLTRETPTREIAIAWRRGRSRARLARRFAALLASHLGAPTRPRVRQIGQGALPHPR